MDNGESSYRRFLNGEENAFDEVLEIYRDSLIFFINRYVCDLYAAEDIAINVFMELIIHKHRYNFKTSLKTYLFTIGRHKAIDYLRHRGKFEMVELSDVQAELEDYASLEETVISGERKRMVSSAIEKLPEDMKIAIHLVYFDGFSYEDTAKIMKKSRKQVDNILYRAKKALRSVIGEEGKLFL